MYLNKTAQITSKGQAFSVSTRRASLTNAELHPASSCSNETRKMHEIFQEVTSVTLLNRKS